MAKTTRPLVYINKREVMRRTSLSYDTIWRMMQKGTFPMSMPIGPKLVRWFEHEVDDWMLSRPRGMSSFKPDRKGRGYFRNGGKRTYL